MKVEMNIVGYFDVEEFKTKDVEVEVTDHDGLGEVSNELLYAVLLAELNSVRDMVFEAQPRLRRIDQRANDAEGES